MTTRRSSGASSSTNSGPWPETSDGSVSSSMPSTSGISSKLSEAIRKVISEFEMTCPSSLALNLGFRGTETAPTLAIAKTKAK